MTEYLIGFRSGERLALKNVEGVPLVNEIVAALDSDSKAPVHWLHTPGVLLNLSEIIYVMPRNATVK